MQRDIAPIIFETLKERILTLELKPGEVLTESAVCKEFEASRTPARSALQRLADAGLIDLLPYQDTRVSLIDLEIAKQMIFMRTVMETELICNFIDKEDLFDIEDLEHIIRKQEILLNTNFKAEDFYKMDAEMHELWFSKGNCLEIWNILQSSVHYTRLKMLDIVQERDFIGILNEHKQLLSLIKEGNKDEVKKILENHFLGGLKRMSTKLVTEYKNYFN